MSRLRSRRRGKASGPNMTPMVDVVLVILIFFMSATGLAVREQFLRTGLPAQDGGPAEGAQNAAAPTRADELPASRALLRLERDGPRTIVTGLGMSRVGLHEVAERLEAFARAGASDTIIVIVAAAGDVPYQDVVLVHDACARAGVRNVRLGVVGG